MLAISEEHLNNIFTLAGEHHPEEVCGIITAKENSTTSSRFIPMRNAAQSESFFQFDSKEQLQVWREMDVSNEYPMVIFHTHTASIAYPSNEDIEFALEPDSHYLIISTDERVAEKYRSFRIFNGKVIEENVRVLKKNN